MNRLFIFFILLTFFSCKTKVPLFEIYQEAGFSFPLGKDPISTHHYKVQNIPSFLNQTLAEKKLSLSDVDELYAGKGKIISFPDNANLGVINRISIWIFKDGDYSNRIEIYYRDEVPDKISGELKLLSTGEDIREILKEKSYNLDVAVQFKYFVPQTIDCRLIYSFAGYSE